MRSDDLGPGYLILMALCAIVLMFALAALFAPAARAHDHQRPELTEWFKGLKSYKGMCCDGSDALHLRDVDWEVQNKERSHYRVRIPKSGDGMAKAAMGETVATMWVDVPDDAVVTEPNKDGATLVWPIYGYLGASVRCFMPGVMT